MAGGSRRRRRLGACGLACAVALSGAFAALEPQPVRAAGGTTIDVYSDCGGSADGAGQALVNAMQAAQDGNASSECSGLGPSLNSPYTLVLDPAYTYVLTQPNNYSDGPDGLPAVIDQVTLESAVPGELAVIQRNSGQPFRFFDVAAPSSTSSGYSGMQDPQYQTPSDVTGQTTTAVPSPGGSLTLQDIALEGGLAQGGNGTDCGAGGLGAGGAIFSHGGDVTLVDSVLEDDAAFGGAGAAEAVACLGGGGGMGGSGGVGGSYGGGGGGTQGDGAAGTSSVSGNGGGPNGGTSGQDGGYNGGGGGSGGSGGFGGGGGSGGSGGFGGGGGSFGNGSSNGGFGGGEGSAGYVAGFGGGSSGSTLSSSGGGGGMGGAVFAVGGSLTITGSTLAGNQAAGGAGAGSGVNGSGYGGAIFVDAQDNGPTSVQIQGTAFGGPLNPDTASTSNNEVYVYPSNASVAAGSILPGPASQLSFAVSPGNAVVVGEPLSVQPRVVVQDASGNTVTGAGGTVTLSITPGTNALGATLGGTATEPVVGGQATFGGLSVDEPGTYTLTATYSGAGVTPAVSQPFVVEAGSAALVPLSLSSTSVPPGGTVTVSGAVYDAAGHPVPTSAVDLAASAGSIAPTVTADVYGGFTATYTAPDAAGPVTLTATVAGTAVTGTTMLTVAAGTPAAMTLVVSPSSVDTGGSATISGVVDGPNGVPVPGAQVDLSVSSGTVAASVYTGPDGAYTAAFTAPAGAGPVLLTASVPSQGLSLSSGLAVMAQGGNASGTAAGVATTTGDASAGGAGNLADLDATATDGTGAIAVVQYGSDPVGGAPPAGNDTFFDAGLTAGASFASVTLQDCGLTGQSVAYWWTGATWELVSPQTSGGGGCLFLGPFAATGTSPTLAELTGTPFAVATAGSAAQVAVSAGSGQSATVGAAFATALAAKVSDASGNPVSGVQVSFTAPATGAGGSFPGGATTLVETTDANGVATAPAFTANDTAGSYPVTASASGATPANFRLTNLPAAAAQLGFSTSPGGAVAGQPFVTQPVVRVEDPYGNTVTGDGSAVTVVITPGTGAPSASLGGTATVNAVGGVASFSGLSIDRPGTGYTLTATDGALTPAVAAAFAVTAAAPGSIALTSSAATVAPGGVLTVSGAVYDALGNPIAGVTVDLSATAGSIPARVVTGSDGRFASQYTAPSGAGQVTLGATVAGTAVGASATVAVTAGGAAALTLDLSASSVAAGGGVTVSGRLQDSHGNPEAGVAVSLAASAGAFGGSGTVSESVNTSAGGDYTATFTAPSAAGPVTLAASVPGQSFSSEAVLVVVAASGQAYGTSVSFAVSGSTAAGGPGSPTPDTSVTANGGTGAAAVVQYGSDPVSTTPPEGAGTFFDAGVSAGSTFQAVTVQDCGLAGQATAFWWDHVSGVWVQVRPQVSAEQPDGTYCLDLGPFASSGTSPTLADLGGTPFAVATSLAAGDTLAWSPSPLAATGSLGAGRTVTAAVYAQDGAGHPLPGVTVYLSFTPSPGGGSASADGTPLTAIPQGFATDGGGAVAVTYAAPPTLPDGGTDSLTAAAAASGGGPDASDSYTFGSAGGSGGGGGGAAGGSAVSVVPVVTGVQPDTGPAAGGTAVTVSGNGFTGATAVDFETVAATTFSVDSGTQITATSPAGTGTVDVTVTTPYGTSATGSADQFSYAVPSSQTLPATPPTFSDVPAGYWAAQYIETLAATGIVNGFPDGTFRPGGAVTRAQFVKMLDLTLGLKPASGTTPFTDVPSDAWYAPYVSAAVQAGIVAGLTPTTFGPNGTLTREQMAVLLARALKLTQTATLHFADDAMVDAWAMSGVEEAVATGYINGFPNGAFQPQGTTTRAQAAKVLAMVLSQQAGATGTTSASSSGRASGPSG